MDEWQPGELYCTHCGQQQINQEIITEKSKSATYGRGTGPKAGPQRPRIDDSEDAIEPSISDMESTITIVEKKTPERLYAEDRMTHKVCKDGGWWNPITKECQGEGNGHNIVDNPDEM